MPETMPAVRRTLALLERLQVAPVTLLVVPGTGWDARGIDELKALAHAGYALAGHGWRHHVEQIRGLRHRLHSLLLSRHVAEHLALDRHGVQALMRRCADWFEGNGLSAPALYVPPAWATGDLDATTVSAAGFRYLERFDGVLDSATGALQRSPVLGYEADAALRVPVLRLWNALGRQRAARLGVVRIGIHPRDIDYPLRNALIADLARYPRYAHYAAVMPDLRAIARNYSAI
jgi:predicted deacetylase